MSRQGGQAATSADTRCVPASVLPSAYSASRAALLFAAAVLRALPYPDPKCDSGGDNCAANAAEYAIEARETIWDFATTFFPATITFVLGYWFTRERDA